jgi:hypothetical protein
LDGVQRTVDLVADTPLTPEELRVASVAAGYGEKDALLGQTVLGCVGSGCELYGNQKALGGAGRGDPIRPMGMEKGNGREMTFRKREGDPYSNAAGMGHGGRL